jgi:hypothetical protein
MADYFNLINLKINMKTYKLRTREKSVVKIFLFGALFFTGFIHNAKADPELTVLWGNQFGGEEVLSGGEPMDYAQSIDSGGNIYVGGTTSGVLPGQAQYGQHDAFVRKYDGDGNILWTRQFGTENSEDLIHITVDTTGVYVTGLTGGVFSGEVASGFTDIFVRKYTLDGDVVWTHQFGTERDDEPLGGIVVNASGVLVTGYILGDTLNDFVNYVIIRKYTQDGELVWSHEFPDDGVIVYMPQGSSMTNEALYVVGTVYDGNTADSEAFVTKYDNNGTKIWVKQLAEYDLGVAASAHDSQIYVVGRTGGTDYFVQVIDENGEYLWSEQFEGSGSNEALPSITRNPSNPSEIFIAGDMPASDSFFVRKYNSTDGFQWSSNFMSNSGNFLTGIAFEEGSVFATGWTWNTNFLDPSMGSKNDADAFIARLLVGGVNNAPTLNPIGNQQTDEGQNLNFTITASDPDNGDTLTYSASNLPEGATFDSQTGEFSWTPSYGQAGNYPDVEFSVMDDGSPMQLDTELITITINHVNRAPVFTLIGSQEVLENQPLTFTVSADDPDSDSFVLSVVDLPSGSVFNPSTGIFSWTPSFNQEGSYVVNFVAIDNGIPSASSTLEVSITVGNVPTPTEQAGNLIDVVINHNFSTAIENSYLANLRKVPKFIEDGKISAAINQLNAFIQKVTDDAAQGKITEEVKTELIGFANDLIDSLSN